MIRVAGVSLREKYSGQLPPAWETGEAKPEPQPVMIEQPKKRRGRPPKVRSDGDGA